jgi:hypothetical protein
MLLPTSLLAVLASIPFSISLPTSISPSTDPYICGYALTLFNSSAYVSLSASNTCGTIYYNKTSDRDQPALAYKLWGGCECGFYEYVFTSYLVSLEFWG